MTITELRETIETLLADLAGQYTLPNGTATPAIYVDGKYGVPKDWKVKGLEVTMRQYPNRSYRPLMGTVQITKRWEVILSQYSPSAETLEVALDRVARHFPDAQFSDLTSTDRDYQYVRIVIPDPDIVFQYKHSSWE